MPKARVPAKKEQPGEEAMVTRGGNAQPVRRHETVDIVKGDCVRRPIARIHPAASPSVPSSSKPPHTLDGELEA
jgi:mannose-6-phosphate isomerase-like protein (cupin superfamily)